MDDLTNVFETAFIAMEGSDDGTGHYRRRIVTTNDIHVYVGVRKPSNARLIQFMFPEDTIPAAFHLPEFHTLEVEQAGKHEGEDRGKHTITLCASEKSFNDVFTSLAADIAKRVGGESSSQNGFHTLLTRLSRWQRLLQRDRINGLTSIEQLGLYGELYMLDTYLLNMVSDQVAVSAWAGPSGAPQDFQFPRGVALEVKSSLSRPPHELFISSEHQLDTDGLRALFLMYLLFDSVRGSADTLPMLVERIRGRIAAAAPLQFEEALLESGYLDIHEKHYQNTGYSYRGSTIYHVCDGFPRITQPTLPAGIGRVNYAISASACESYTTVLTELSSAIRGEM